MKVQKELTKLYYSIGEIAEMFDVSNSLIRYWESEFPQLHPKKNRRGDRQYMVKDIQVIEKIYTLVKERGFTLDGAKKELKSKTTDTIDQRQDIIDKLNGIKSSLIDLSKKIE